MSEGATRSAVVFGARNLGRAIIETLVADGWAVAGVARSQETLDLASASGATPLQGDVTDAASVRAALEHAARDHGRVDLVVNAAGSYGTNPGRPFGGGPISEAAPDAYERWVAPPAQAAFTFLSVSGRFATEQGGPSTLVQVTGGSARRARAGTGLWAAGAFATKAIANAAALELRPLGIHVALVIVDAAIEPLSGDPFPGIPLEAQADPFQLAGAVRFLAEQGARSATHELVLTPLAESWTP